MGVVISHSPWAGDQRRNLCETMKEVALILLLVILTQAEDRPGNSEGKAGRNGRQLAGLGWRLIEASREAEQRDKELGQRNMALIKTARRDFWARLGLAIEREELLHEDNRNNLANRFNGVREALNNAMARDERRRRENAAALHQMMEVLLPTRRVIGFWSNVARSLRKKI